MLLLVALSRQRTDLDISVRPSLLIQCSPNIFRIPDVSVFEGALLEDVPSRPPLVTFEVMTDGEALPPIRAKVRDHVAGGARNALVIAPSVRDVLVEDGRGLRSVEGRRLFQLGMEKGTLVMDFDALFAELDRELSRR